MDVLLVPADAAQPDGAEVVRKTAAAPEDRARLLREAHLLRVAAERGLPGLPRVVSPPSPDADEPCLVTAAVAGPSLALAAPLPVVEVAGVAAEVARLLAALHQAGLVHGAVEPGHVVLDGAGGLILVGFGSGGPVGSPAADPADGELDPADDVAAWGLLVAHLLDWSATADDEPLVALRRTLASRRAHRRARPLPPPRSDDEERRVLAALADQAQDPDPARRPAARGLAAAIAHRIPTARVPGAVPVAPPQAPAGGLLDRLAAHVVPGVPPAATAQPVSAAATPAVEDGEDRADVVNVPRRRRRPTSDPEAPARRLIPVAALAGVAAALLAVPVAVTAVRAPGPAAAPPPAVACPPAAPPAADVDGDGCEEPVRWEGGILQVGSARFAFGTAADAWAIGDWDCDGRRTPALLHGGALSVFDAWPPRGGELEGRTVAAAAGPAALGVIPGPDGCDRPVLRRPGTGDLVVDARRAP